MSNHAHLVVRVDAKRAQEWSQEEVLRRWTRLYVGPELVQSYLWEGEGGLCAAERVVVQEWAETYRARLADLSWFMRVLNQSIARMANAEDQVTGRFWEGRFKSHALLDEAAVLTAMAYVDLNPIRARLATVPEDSAFTSIAERLKPVREGDAPATESAVDVPNGDYSAIATDPHQKAQATQQQFSTAIGTPEHLAAHCLTRNIAFLRGISAARALFERRAA